jgi:ferrochelatase
VVKQAVLLLAHGTPETIEQIPEYLRNVVSGRPLPQTVVEEIQHRYAQIGHSPLTEITFAQARLAEEELAAVGHAVPVYVGMRNWRPYISEVVQRMRADGIEEAAVICMAPQNSRTSVGLYRRAVYAAAGDGVKVDFIRIDFIDGWADHPLLADAFAARLLPVWQKVSEETGAAVPVLFTAHSVPQRTVEPQAATSDEPAKPADPYADDAKRTAQMVADRIPGLKEWRFAFQSQGMSGGPWIGPTVEETLTALYQEGNKAVVIQPIGFLCDHVEILYDIDIGFREFAAKMGLRIERPESLNESALLTSALADLARQGLARLGNA